MADKDYKAFIVEGEVREPQVIRKADGEAVAAKEI